MSENSFRKFIFAVIGLVFFGCLVIVYIFVNFRSSMREFVSIVNDTPSTTSFFVLEEYYDLLRLSSGQEIVLDSQLITDVTARARCLLVKDGPASLRSYDLPTPARYSYMTPDYALSKLQSPCSLPMEKFAGKLPYEAVIDGVK